MGRPLLTLSVLGALAGPGALHAETAFDLIFRSGTLDGLPQGTELRYDAEGPTGAEADWRQVTVDLLPGDEAVVERWADEGDTPAQVLGSFRDPIGNPVAMLFLERTVRAIAEQTGGSPYYIRNRMRDALGGPGKVEAVTVPWDGASVPATAVALTPFADDAHRDNLGAFADLEIRVVMSEEVPGWYHSMSVEAPATGDAAGYEASLALAGVGP